MVPPWCLNLVGEPKFILTPRGHTSLKAFLNPTPSVGFSFIQKNFSCISWTASNLLPTVKV